MCPKVFTLKLWVCSIKFVFNVNVQVHELSKIHTIPHQNEFKEWFFVFLYCCAFLSLNERYPYQFSFFSKTKIRKTTLWHRHAQILTYTHGLHVHIGQEMYPRPGLGQSEKTPHFNIVCIFFIFQRSNALKKLFCFRSSLLVLIQFVFRLKRKRIKNIVFQNIPWLNKALYCILYE